MVFENRQEAGKRLAAELLKYRSENSYVLVDDGMATGVTAKAAIEAVRKLNPKKIVLAIPVCVLDTVEGFKKLADEVICLAAPYEFMAVGLWYRNFTQVSDEEVAKLLKKAKG